VAAVGARAGAKADQAALATATAAAAATHPPGSPSLPGASASHVPAPEGILFYSVRPSAGAVPPLAPSRDHRSGHAGDLPPQPHDPDLLGQVDGVEGGVASGWACVRGAGGGGSAGGKVAAGSGAAAAAGAAAARKGAAASTPAHPATPPLLVSVYVDGVHVGDAEASGPTPHPLVHRLCSAQAGGVAAGRGGAGPPKKGESVLAAAAASAGALVGVGWTVRLPPLPQGRHELTAFTANPARTARQALAQSPLPFLESAATPDPAAALARKDAIIRVRNAQVAALWDELHTRQPWRNALAEGDGPVSFGAATVVGTGDKEGGGGQASASNATASSPPYTAVLAINTGLGSRARRDALRRTWVPSNQPGGLAALERQHRIVIRFFVGYSDQVDDPAEAALTAEAVQHGDIMRLDHVDTYADLSAKTLKLFTVLPQLWDAAFYFKVDDDVAINVPALAAYLDARRGEGNLYLGCMKSGAVLTDRRYKWFEPEWWRFGDPAAPVDGAAALPAGAAINYPRHASGQLYGLSGPVARYLARAGPVLHRFANEDVTLGAWLLGLEVTHVDERRLCCDSPDRCAAQTGPGNVCLGYFEMACAGICAPDKRLEPIYAACMDDPLHKPRGQVSDLLARVPPWDVNLLAGAGGGAGDEAEAVDGVVDQPVVGVAAQAKREQAEVVEEEEKKPAGGGGGAAAAAAQPQQPQAAAVVAKDAVIDGASSISDADRSAAATADRAAGADAQGRGGGGEEQG